ncbi:MAG: hypothetical protein E5V30_11870, partial [Mesorhizobium sp.]
MSPLVAACFGDVSFRYQVVFGEPFHAPAAPPAPERNKSGAALVNAADHAGLGEVDISENQIIVAARTGRGLLWLNTKEPRDENRCFDLSH